MAIFVGVIWGDYHHFQTPAISQTCCSLISFYILQWGDYRIIYILATKTKHISATTNCMRHPLEWPGWIATCMAHPGSSRMGWSVREAFAESCNSNAGELQVEWTSRMGQDVKIFPKMVIFQGKTRINPKPSSKLTVRPWQSSGLVQIRFH